VLFGLTRTLDHRQGSETGTKFRWANQKNYRSAWVSAKLAAMRTGWVMQRPRKADLPKGHTTSINRSMG